MAEKVHCHWCGQKAYRGRDGKILIHTVLMVGDKFGDPLRAVVCNGWERGARP